MAVISNEELVLGQFDDVQATGFQLEAGAYTVEVVSVDYVSTVFEKKDGTGTGTLMKAVYKLTPIGSFDAKMPEACYKGRIITMELSGFTPEELVGKIATLIRDTKMKVSNVGAPMLHKEELPGQHFNAVYQYDNKGYGRINLPMLAKLN